MDDVYAFTQTIETAAFTLVMEAYTVARDDDIYVSMDLNHG